MGEITNYKKDFVERTREILIDDYGHFEHKNREVTFLLNCLLGLIVAILEMEKKAENNNKTFNHMIESEFLNFVPEKIGFHKERRLVPDNASLIPLNTINFEHRVAIIVGHKEDLNKKSQSWFIDKLRNSIAHQNIEPINENGKWIGVRLWNEHQSEINFEIEFTIAELKAFATMLADRYLASQPA